MTEALSSPGSVPALAASLPSGWQLWRRQVAAILRLELRKTFLRARALPVYLLAAAPLALLGLRAIVELRSGFADPAGATTIAFARVFQAFDLRFAIFFSCMAIFSYLFRGEMLEKSLHYYLLAPLRREVLLAGKFLAGLLAASLLFATSTLLQLVLLYLPQRESGGAAYLLGDPGLGQPGGYLGVTLLACVGYGSVFLLLGLLAKNPMIPAAFFFGWEGINFLLPPVLKKISVIHYLLSLSPVRITEGAFSFPVEPTPPLVAIAGLLTLAAILLSLAAWRLRRIEILYSGD